MVLVLPFHYIHAHISCISAEFTHFDFGLSSVTVFGQQNKAEEINMLVLRLELKSICLIHFSSCTDSMVMKACLSQPHWFQRRVRDTWSTAGLCQQRPTLTSSQAEIPDKIKRLSSQAHFGSLFGPVDMWEINAHCFSSWGFVGSIFLLHNNSCMITWYHVSYHLEE